MRLNDLQEGIKFNPSIGNKIAQDPNAKMGVEYEFYLHPDYEHSLRPSLGEYLEMYADGLVDLEFNNDTDKPCFYYNESLIIKDDGEWQYVDRNGVAVLYDQIHHFIRIIFQPEIMFAISSLEEGDTNTAKEYFNKVTTDYEDVEQFLKFINKDDLLVVSELIKQHKNNDLDNYLKSNNMNSDYFESLVEQLDEWLEDDEDFDLTYANKNLKLTPVDRKPDRFEVLEIIEDYLNHTSVTFDRVEYDSEHSPIIEVVTDVLSIEDGIENIRNMLNFIQGDDLPLYTDQSCGMHVSISYKGASNTFDLNKFIVLLNTERIQSLFPKRHFITDLDDQVMEVFNVIYNEVLDADNNNRSYNTLLHNLQNPLPVIKSHFNKVVNNHISLVPTNNKNQAINFEDFHIHNGRIELRYVGGDEDAPYETRFKLLEFEVLRAIYMLQISNTKMYESEYKKKLYSYYEGIIDTLQDIYYHLENKDYDEIQGSFIRYKLDWILQ